MQEISQPQVSAEEQKEIIFPEGKQEYELDFVKWGYDAKFSYIINVRIEQAHAKPVF